MSGFWIPAASKMSTTCSVTSAWSMVCFTLASSSALLMPETLPEPSLNLASRAFTAWKNATTGAASIAFGWGTANANACDMADTAIRNRVLPSPWSTPRMCSSASRMMFSLQRYRLWSTPDNWSHAWCHPALPASLAGWLQLRLALMQDHPYHLPQSRRTEPLQIWCNTEVINDQTTNFVFIDTVYSCNGLHEVMTFHWFVDIERVHT